MDELIVALIRMFFGSQQRRSAPPPMRRPGGPASPPNFQSPLLPQPRQMSAQDRIRAAARPPAGPRRNAPPPPIGGRRPPARRPVSMPPVMVAAPIVTQIVPRPGTTAPITKPLAASVTAVKKSEKSKAIRSWMTPAKLRKQYILTEILQPPVSLREPK